jgi:two-component system, cell cycle sensor histidine kinase and response regulator CckA
VSGQLDKDTISNPNCSNNGNSSSPDPHKKATGTILLVEDTPSLREVTNEFLQLAGYHVLQAGNGMDALALAREYSQPIHLLLTDIIMPGMAGTELSKNLRTFHPESRVLFMSGYSDNRILQREGIDGTNNLLGKPFTRDKLTRKVREILST